MKHGISVICLVYNEEKRIERFIKSFYNFDEIIILDKSSIDKTVDIAESFGVKTINVPFTDNGTVWQIGVDEAKFDWVLLLTASDVIHPEFTKLLYKKIDDEEFNKKYTSANIPTTMHILGLSGPYLHTDWKWRHSLSKKDCLKMGNRIHEEVICVPDIRYTFPYDREIAVHHLSHESLETCYERQLRYSKEEIKKGLTYKDCFKSIFKEVVIGIRLKVWRAGWQGIGTSLLMISYRMLTFLRLLEKESGEISKKYNDYAEELINGNDVEFRNSHYKELFINKKKDKNLE